MKMSIDESMLYEMGYNTGFKDGIKGSIPKDQYEARLKADLKAILVDLQLEIEEYKSDRLVDMERDEMARIFSELIQQKINALEAETEET
jgi:hypothetical protein